MSGKVKLGCEAKDTITGYTGIVVCLSEWLNGCKRITLQAKELRDGQPLGTVCVDIEQVDVVTEETVFNRVRSVAVIGPAAVAGGPHDPPSRSLDPK